MPSLSFEEAREILKRDNEEFAHIYAKHQELDKHLLELEARRFLTPDEEVEEKKLKKEKLRLKDKMAAMIQEYQASLVK